MHPTWDMFQCFCYKDQIRKKIGIKIYVRYPFRYMKAIQVPLTTMNHLEI